MMTERIQKAINIFLVAINDGTLAAGNCAACAVGNLVAHGMDIKITKHDVMFMNFDSPHSAWVDAFCFDDDKDSRLYVNDFMITDDRVQDCINATDFSLEELYLIEMAFEKNSKISYHSYCLKSKKEIRADQIKALNAVIEVMKTFDNVSFDTKKEFTSKAKLQAV